MSLTPDMRWARIRAELDVMRATKGPMISAPARIDRDAACISYSRALDRIADELTALDDEGRMGAIGRHLAMDAAEARV